MLSSDTPPIWRQKIQQKSKASLCFQNAITCYELGDYETEANRVKQFFKKELIARIE